MSGDVQLELYLHEYKMAALSSVLEEQGSSVEERMQEMLIDLYSEMVPYEVQQEIRTHIDTEFAAEQAAIEAARKHTAWLDCSRLMSSMQPDSRSFAGIYQSVFLP